MRLSIRITIISTILLLLYCCSMVAAQEVRVVPITPGAAPSPAMTRNPTNAVSIPSTQLPLQAPTTVPSGFTGLIQQLPATPVGTPLPSTTGGPLPQVPYAPPQAPNGGIVSPPVTPPQPYIEPLSPFEEYIRTGVPGALNFDISQFGYQLFRQPPSSFAPLQNIPVESTYVVGPGDEIRISVWGSFDGQWSVMVDRNGQISLPRIGTIGVTGLTFEQLKSSLINEFKKYFTDFEMNISMGQLRSILVYVVGNARKPGAYSLSSMSTLMNALFESGGPDKNGTMRDVQLKRGGKTIVHFDLYDMLLKGDKSRDARLMPGDVIFIPTVGPLVGIAGQVNQPAIYELSRATSLSDLIKMAGGLKGMAFKGRFQMQRVTDHRVINVVEGDLADIQLHPDKNITLQDGDLVKIFGVPELKNLVNLAGAVLIPGEYGITPGVTTIKELVERAGGLQPFASAQAELTRLTITQEGPITTVTDFDVKLALQNDPLNNLSLQNYDYLKIRTVPDWQLSRKVTITGEVKFPGTYAARKGERLSSLLERAGSFTDKAYLVGTIFQRERVRALEQRQILQMVDRLEMELMASGTSDISASLSSDEARIFAEEMKQKRAFLDSLRKIEPQGRVVVKLEAPERLKNSVYDVELEEADTFFIPTNPETVQVIGAVFNQTAFVYQRGKSYSDYIYLCGGYSESADTDNVYVLKTNGSAVRPSGVFSWDRISHKWSFGNGQDMEPGDTVVVPQKLDRIAWLREVKDFTQILYQIAVTAGVLIIAF